MIKVNFLFAIYTVLGAFVVHSVLADKLPEYISDITVVVSFVIVGLFPVLIYVAIKERRDNNRDEDKQLYKDSL